MGCFGYRPGFDVFGPYQGVLTVETFSAIPVIAGCVILLAGWAVFRVLAFPILFLFFAVPMPDWLIDAATVPLKVFISDVVTQVLYALGYPIAQNGVMIMINSYQLHGEGCLFRHELDLCAFGNRCLLLLCFSMGYEDSWPSPFSRDRANYDHRKFPSRFSPGADCVLRWESMRLKGRSMTSPASDCLWWQWR